MKKQLTKSTRGKTVVIIQKISKPTTKEDELLYFVMYSPINIKILPIPGIDLNNVL